MLELLVSGGTVTAKQLRAVLDDALWQSYQNGIEQARWEREMAEAGKLMFADYNRRLSIANMLYGRYEQLSNRRSPRAVKLGNRVDGLYELAIEALQETLSRDRSAEMYIQAGYSDDPSESTISY